MSTQLSQTTPAAIGDVFLTRDATESGVPVLAILREDAWCPIRRNVGDVLGNEVQEFDIGGDDGTEGWPITIEFVGATDVLYAALDEQRRVVATSYAATLPLAATDGDGDERVLTFAGLRWVDLDHSTASGANDRFAARLYRRVVAKLVSEV